MIQRNKKGQFIKGGIPKEEHNNWKGGISLRPDYYKEYRKKNREKINQYAREYRKRNPDKEKLKREKFNKKYPDWYKKLWLRDRDKINEKHRLTFRETGLSTNGKRYSGLIKRGFPSDNKCEICGKECGKEVKRLNYHHWDDNDLKKGKHVKGIWVCVNCHRVCEFTDDNKINCYKLIQKYIKLKNKINKSYDFI